MYDLAPLSSCVRFSLIWRTQPCNAIGFLQLTNAKRDSSISATHVVVLSDCNLPNLFDKGPSSASKLFVDIFDAFDINHIVAAPNKGNSTLGLLLWNSRNVTRSVKACAPIGSSDH